MSWTSVTFGRYKGKTLPQIVVLDPDWVFWAAQEDIFEDQLAKELHDLVAKAKAIRIPKRREDCYLIEYRREHGDRFSGFSIVKAESPQDLRWTVREPCLDLSWTRRHRTYDKRAGRRLSADFRRIYFQGRNLTKKRVEAFFSDDANFLNARECGAPTDKPRKSRRRKKDKNRRGSLL